LSKTTFAPDRVNVGYEVLQNVDKRDRLTRRKRWEQQKKDLGHEIKEAAEIIGHEIKENTELAEHETGIHNVKKDAKSENKK
jgi:hypothetical protein